MSYNINLGGWNSIFAVPSRVVDVDIKTASESQLKVLLYILRHSNENLTNNQIAEVLTMHPSDVGDCIKHWIDRGLIVNNGNELLPANESHNQVVVEKEKIAVQKNTAAAFSDNNNSKVALEPEKPKLQRNLSRAQRPDPIFVAQRLSQDSELVTLMDEAQIILGKPLSSGDTATLVMLHDTDGLPVDVLIMLMQYCVSIDKGNIRMVERIGLSWSSEGITTLQAAENKIKQVKETSNAWNKVSRTFGIVNVGSPTKKQLEYAQRWVLQWGFTTDMLREAYERCVDSKGEYNLKYIDGILKRWQNENIKCLADIEKQTRKMPAKHSANTKSGSIQSNASYDLEAYEKSSIFDE